MLLSFEGGYKLKIDPHREYYGNSKFFNLYDQINFTHVYRIGLDLLKYFYFYSFIFFELE